MKIGLINAKGPEGTMVSLPHGLLQLSAQLKSQGHEVSIIDYNFPLAVVPYENLLSYDLVGISAMTTQLSHSVEIADFISDRTKVVWGGIHTTLDPISVLKRYRNHFVVSGEGELPLLDLIDHLEGRRDLSWLAARRGACFVHNGQFVINKPYFIQDINDLDDLDYEDLPYLERYLVRYDPFFQQTVTQFQIIVSRGCHWNCRFCINALFRKHGGHYRSKSIAKIRRESEPLIDSLDIKLVEPRAEDFFIDKELLDGWAEYAREKGFLWCANSRFNYVGQKVLPAKRLLELEESGLYNLGMAVEAGCEEIRNKVLNKRVTDAQIDNAIQVLSKNFGRRMTVGTSFIVYFPGDTLDSRIKIIRWMEKIAKSLNCVFSGPQMYRSYPGSPLYEAEEKKFDGDLDYYLNEMRTGGTYIKKKYTSHFYSLMLINYYNSFFQNLHLEIDQQGKPAWSLADKAGGLVYSPVINRMMAPIRWRLQHDYWKFFIDPALIGWLHLHYMAFARVWRKVSPGALVQRLRVWLNTKDFYLRHKDSLKKYLRLR